jgi:hypothetical protein
VQGFEALSLLNSRSTSMTVITPTVGRVVWYHRGARSGFTGHHYEDQPLAAHVAYVNDDGSINLMVIDAHGTPFAVRNVPLVQDGGVVPDDAAAGPGWAEWMPYQKGQAAKTEQLAAQAAATQAKENADADAADEKAWTKIDTDAAAKASRQ